MRLVFKREHYGALIITYFVPFVYILTRKERSFFNASSFVAARILDAVNSLKIMADNSLTPLEKGRRPYKMRSRLKRRSTERRRS